MNKQQVAAPTGGEVNRAILGDGAQIGQLAQGSNITQISGYTVEQVEVLLTQIRTTFQPKPFDGQSPYVGLAAFQGSDADKFFGRETLTAELVTRVAACGASNARAMFTAGPSGSGKSSIVRAGLIPALKKNGIPGSEHWLYLTMKPGRAPLDELGRVVAALTDSRTARQDLAVQGLTDRTILAQRMEMALTDDARQRVVLLIDQFEEVFTQLSPEREPERAAFLHLLTHAATVPNGRVIVLFTLRSDFVTNCATYPDLNALLNQQFLQVGAMTPDELVSAIARPALQVGLRIDPALVAQIVNDVRGEPGALPLMQFALQDLFEAEKERGELTLDGYLKRGGLRQALEHHADAEFEKLSADEKQLARTVFSGLIEIGRGRQDTKRTALFGELVPAGTDAARVQTLVRELADARLITTDEHEGKETVALAHERLIDAWKWLRQLVDENRDAIALQNEIAQDAQEWDTFKRDESYLYRGARLATAQEKLEQKKLVLSGLAQAFVESALAVREQERVRRDAEQKRELAQAQTLAAEQKQRAEAEERARHAAEQRARILRIAAAGLAILLLVAVIATGFAFRANDQATANAIAADQQRALAQTQEAIAQEQKGVAQTAATAQVHALETSQADRQRAENESRKNESRRIAAYSLANRNPAFDRSLILGVEATRRDTNPEVVGNVLDMLTAAPYIAGYLRGDSTFGSVAFSPDGKLLVAGSFDGTIELWDSVTLKSTGRIVASNGDAITCVAYSPDGRILAAATGDKIIFWDAATHEPLGTPLVGHTGTVNSIAFSSDSHMLASGSQDSTVILWDVATRQPLGAPLRGHKGSVNAVVFSSDNRLVASASSDETFFVWDTQTHQIVAKPLGEPGKPKTTTMRFDLTAAAFSPQGSDLVIGDYQGGVALWDNPSGGTTSTLRTPDSLRTITGLAYSPDGKLLSASDANGRIVVWDTARVEPLGVSPFEQGEHISSLAFSLDNRLLASAGDSGIVLWGFQSQLGQTLEHPTTGANSVESVTFDPSSRTLAAGYSTGSIILWDVASHRQSGEPLVGHAGKVTNLTYSHNGLVLASGDQDGLILLWDSKTGRQLAKLVGHTGSISGIGFVNDNLLASSSADGTIILWDVGSHQPVGRLDRGLKTAINALAISPDGKILVAGGEDKIITFWDIAARAPIGAPIAAPDIVQTVAFSPDGALLAVGVQGNPILLFDAGTRQALGTFFDSQTAIVTGFSADGKILASGDELWDVASRQPIRAHLTYDTPSGTTLPRSSSISPDAKWLAQGTYEASVILWDLDLQAWKNNACHIANRNLTRSEWEQYVKSPNDTWDDYIKNPTCPNLPVESEFAPTPTPTP